MANAKQLTLMSNGKGQPEKVKNGSKIVVIVVNLAICNSYNYVLRNLPYIMLDLAERNFKET